MYVPIIKVRDKESGKVHIVGSNHHDRLIKGEHGLEYLNIQCQDGTMDGYEFALEECDDGWRGKEYYVEMIPVEDAIALWTKMEQEHTDGIRQLKEILAKMYGGKAEEIGIIS